MKSRTCRLARLAVFYSLACSAVSIQAAEVTSTPVALIEIRRPASVSSSTGPVPSPEHWRDLARADLTGFADAMRQNYIYAAYPDPTRWHAWFDRKFATVMAEVHLIHDEAGYRAVLTDLAAAFQDAHVSVRFNPPRPMPSNWPGFLARFDNGAYRITASRVPRLVDGARVSACDGKPISWWIGTIARHEVGRPDTLETARNDAALRLFVDRGSPLRPRPAHCTIGGRSVMLRWTPTPSEEINPIIRSWRGGRTAAVDTRLIGNDGAWVKLGYFQPSDEAQAEAFHAAIVAAPSLRGKRFIILDVRGNGGGPYNWFMAYLRALYGPAYADHYAKARLQIRAVYRLSPAYLRLNQEDESAASGLAEPADPPYEINDAADARLQEQAIAAAEPIFRSTPIATSRSPATPVNPVHAHVYVLTDYGCASACIGFVDELKRFPGVRQIGLPTAVDSRSGTAVEIELPSKRATASIAAMTRDGRIRNDNEPQQPSIRFTGDIRNDRAVETWVRHDVVAGE